MFLFCRTSFLLEGFIRNKNLVTGIDDIRIWTFLPELSILWMLVDCMPVGKTILLRDARQTFTLFYSMRFRHMRVPRAVWRLLNKFHFMRLRKNPKRQLQPGIDSDTKKEYWILRRNSARC